MPNLPAPYMQPVAPAPAAAKPRFRDFKDTNPYGVGRGVFRRLRAAGAFDDGSTLRQSNPFLAEGQADWQNNPLHQFVGPGRMRPTLRNTMGAISGILDQRKAPQEAAAARLRALIDSGMPTLDAAGGAVRTALSTTVIPDELLERTMAGARERIGREGGLSRAGIAAALGGSGVREFDPLNAAYSAQEGNTLFQLGQEEVGQAVNAAEVNRQGLIDAIQSAGGYTGNLSQMVQNLLASEEFSNSLSEDEVSALLAIAGLRQAGK